MRSFRSLVLAALLAACFLHHLPAKAQIMTPEATLGALMTEQTIDLGRFSALFLSKVPEEEITRILQQVRQTNGKFLGVGPSGEDFSLHFERADVPARITLDQEGRIAGLWFGAAQPKGSVATYVAAIEALPGRTALLILTDGKPVAAHEAQTPLAVASAGKLAILLALKNAGADGRLAWDRTVTLEAGWKSLPSGQLQDWPVGTPLTIATLAHLMISISDNTATDALIHILGRDAIEAISPRNTPFVTTRETFTLQTQADDLAQWSSADAAGRRAILARIADLPLPRISDLGRTVAHQVDWSMTAEELCTLLDQTAELPSLGINPGPVDRQDWARFAYKGGSDAGVFNLSSRVVGKDGRVHCVVATWNGDSLLDEEKLLLPYRGILRTLAAGK